ncbi:FAD-dependent oxidoreductase [Haloterrigena sp. SYSU A558-1]|uniref:FAD-dependent oxidoreductase n=1 Tax=Haloterrigena gelatinilytica TaxID=2741724 RepID=A0ABX2LFS9_9EURY|nr:FAD-dependent oxidoreductase [Haloterrigena gelatinilytica]NUC74561.1 FAD-dependent oxidoreductase [Haloterrigena gelatinilytica]
MIGVVGGSLSGLAAAYRLRQRGYDVRVFEPGDELGGIAATTSSSPSQYPSSSSETPAAPLERVPVSFTRPGDETALELLAELGLSDRLEWGPIRTAMYVDGTVHPVDAPWEFLAYPPLSLSDTARLATLQSGIDCRGLPRRRPRFDAYEPSEYSDVPAEAFVREHASDAVYERFYGPLLEARFGAAASDVSAAWVLEHCRGRRDRTRFGREKRGYFAESAGVLVESLVDAVGRERITTNARVSELGTTDGAVESITVDRDGASECHAVDAIVLATVPEGFESSLGSPSVTFRTRTCLRVSTTAETALTDAYRVTMVDDAPFGELVAPTLLRSPDAPGGHRYQYYLLDGGEAVADGRSSAAVERRWLEALATRFSAFDRNDLVAVDSTRIRQPVPDGVHSSVDGTSPHARTVDTLDGLYDATVVRQPQFPQRRAGGALEAGLRCARAVSEPNRRVSVRQPADH